MTIIYILDLFIYLFSDNVTVDPGTKIRYMKEIWLLKPRHATPRFLNN
jgi:hypothetical protein